jgi:hypothetical protein
MPEWETVHLTSRCQPAPAEGQIFLPNSVSPPSGRRILVDGKGRAKLMKGGVRSDGGTSACVSGATLAAFGGENTEVRYRGVGFVGTLTRDRWLAVQFAISLLTLIAAGFTAYGTYVKSNGADAGSFANNTAFVVLLITAALSALKFVKEYHEL